MVDNSHHRRRSGHPAAATRAFAVLFVICLVECATGSCLSYGHSCWGAHGKRSGKPPATAPEYLIPLLKRIATNDYERTRQSTADSDLSAIFNVGADFTENKILNEELSAPEYVGDKRNHDEAPRLDENIINKAKLWQLLRAAAATN